ncbi:AMP-binding protein [Pendulispora rubella]|uniref:AMP-binding protein n=1 Tax=Pendulispora rubella TaxID=2741070 RepID=A0ABZ2KTX3_9BACT
MTISQTERTPSISASRRDVILDRLEDDVQANPDALALVMLTLDGERKRWTRGALWEAARRAAGVLAKNGVQRGDVCALILRHHPLFAPFYLGASMLGALPTVLAWPTPRLHPDKFRAGLSGMARKSGLDVIITEPDFLPILEPLLEDSTVRSTILAEEDPTVAGQNRVLVPPSSPFLLQHSSGTTGLQKAVVLNNEAILRDLDGMAKRVGRPDDVLVSWAPLYHDMGLVGNYLYALCMGRPLYLLDPIDWATQPASLLLALSRYRGTLAWLPNFAFAHLARRVSDAELDAANVRLDCVRMWISGGEPVRSGSISAFVNRFARWGVRRNQIGVVYGMAEAVLCLSVTPPGVEPRELTVDRVALEQRGQVQLASDGSSGRTFVSCGIPLEGAEVRIVDTSRRSLDSDTLGEVALRAPFLFAGYHRNPERTSKVLDDGWLYSGDQGFLHEGEIYILGRKDDLIIIAGKNIAPEDLEYATGEVPQVAAGRVIAFGLENESSGTAEAHLLVEPVPSASDLPALAAEITEAVAAATDVTVSGVHFVPPRWLIKSSAGKPARRENIERFVKGEHRGAFSKDASQADTYAEPQTQDEKDLAEIWAHVLGVQRVGRNDSLLLLGGDSLKAASIAALAAKQGFAVTQQQIVKYGTVARIAAAVSRSQGEAPQANVGSVGAFGLCQLDRRFVERLRQEHDIVDAYPLNDVQEQRLFLWVTNKTLPYWVETISLTIRGKFDVVKFRASWERIVERHDALRTSFVWDNVPRAHQIVHRRAALAWKELDWTQMPKDRQAAALEALMQEEVGRPFDLSQPSLFRIVIVRVAADRIVFLSNWHLITLDGWSLEILLREAFQTYEGLVRGSETSLPPSISFRDFRAWAEQQDYSAGIAYAGNAAKRSTAKPNRIEDFVAAAFDKMPRFSFVPLSVGRLSSRSWGRLPTLERAVASADFEKFARNAGLTLNTLLQGAWSVMIARAKRETSTWLSTIHHARNPSVTGVDNIVGQIANPILFLAESADQSVGKWLAAMQERYLDVINYSNTPLGKYVPFFKKLSNVHLYDSLDFLRTWHGRSLGEDCVVEVDKVSAIIPNVIDTIFAPHRLGDKLVLLFGHKLSHVDATLLLEQYEALLRMIIVDPDRNVADLFVQSVFESETPLIS